MDTVVQLFPFFPYRCRVIQESGGREVVQMRTVSAALTPFLTAELCTSAGKCPVVMESPYGRYIVFPYETVKHADVQIIVTHGVDMDQIRSDLLQFPDEEPGVDDIETAVETEAIGQFVGDDVIYPGPDKDLILIVISHAGSAFAEAGIDSVSVLSGLSGDVQDDVSGTGIVVAVD